MSKQPKSPIWIGTENFANNPELEKAKDTEFTGLPIVDAAADDKAMNLEASRRDFLKYLGFGVGAATLAASCDIPVRQAIPYVVKPDAIVPGVATYYASTFVNGGDICSILVKTRDGRPIKIEGNSLSPISKGGTTARAQASILSLYDTSRYDAPYQIVDGEADRSAPMTWETVDAAVGKQLKPSSRIRIVTHTNMGVTFERVIEDFKAKFPGAEVVTYDPISCAAMLDANEQSVGVRVLPDYHFDKANIIVSFGADFLGTWISPAEYARDYAENRRIKDVHHAKMSRHYQFESAMTLTGSNADHRVLVKPSEQGAAIAALYQAIVGGSSSAKLNPKATSAIARIAEDLKANAGKSLVVAGSNNLAEQMLVNAINAQLGNYGNTLSFTHASMQRKGDDKALGRLVNDMKNGSVDAVFFLDNANPVYDTPAVLGFGEALAKVGLKVSFSGVPNETVAVCDYVCPTNHFLESWGDAQPKRGIYTILQPTIQPIWAAVGREGTRQEGETLLRWAGSDKLNADADQPYMEYMKAVWNEDMLINQTKFASFRPFWDSVLHDGVFIADTPSLEPELNFNGGAFLNQVSQPASSELEISFIETVNAGNGSYANNPWLMEMPDPINRCVWGNYLGVPVTWDGGWHWGAYKGLNPDEYRGKADLVDVTVGNTSSRATAVRQFGQMNGTVSLALGYGRTITGQQGKAIGEEVGTNVYPMLSVSSDGYIQYYAANVAVSDKVGQDNEFACVQYHDTMGVHARGEDGEFIKAADGDLFNVGEKTANGIPDPLNDEGFQGGIVDRSIIFKGNLPDVVELEHDIEHFKHHAEHLNDQTLYPYKEYVEDYYSQGHWWAMHVDLNACIGCGACQVACIAENNVPVVGKREVFRHHEMTWMRIDRYFYGDYENPNTVYQPMMCQHCDNAPCENVCPVAATNHSAEGLNQMTYNRCIGTRYCANNCPYKVRRFNWLDYTTADIFASNEFSMNGEQLPFGADNLTRMVLNPDVTVRSRGVIEKCSFCVQRIQEGKLTAKRENRQLRDSDVKSACQTACPTGAIVFGDRNMKNSEVSKRLENPLNYNVLQEVNTKSSVFYQAKVLNRNEKLA